MSCYEYKTSDYRHEKEVRLICYLEGDFSHWESEDKSIKMFASIEKNVPKLHLQLARNNNIYCCVDQLELANSKELNKAILSGDEI